MAAKLSLTAGVIVAILLVASVGAVTASGSVYALANPGRTQVKRIAFVRGRSYADASVWVALANGHSESRLGAGAHPRISPNGQLVGAAGPYEQGREWLALFSTNGQTSETFFDRAGVYASPVAWSPDSRYLAADVSSSGHQELVVIDTTTMRATKIATGGAIDGASFDPATTGPDGELVYSISPSPVSGSSSGRPDLFTARVDGTDRIQLTSNGRSRDPIWGTHGIVFVQGRLYGTGRLTSQLWLRSGSRTTQLTHLKLADARYNSVDAPVGVSRDGNRILFATIGEDDVQDAWTLQLKPRRVKEVKVNGLTCGPFSISANGDQLLVADGAWIQGSSRYGYVYAVPFGGRHARKVTHGAFPSWNL